MTSIAMSYLQNGPKRPASDSFDVACKVRITFCLIDLQTTILKTNENGLLFRSLAVIFSFI